MPRSKRIKTSKPVTNKNRRCKWIIIREYVRIEKKTRW